MGRKLIWDGAHYKNNRAMIESRKLMRIIVPLCLLAAAILSIFATGSFAPMPVVFLIGAIVAWNVLNNNFSDRAFRLCVNSSYYESMQHAVTTSYPHGISFILKNVISTLQALKITAFPYRDKWYEYTIGWPNQTILREAVDAADYLSTKWDDMEPAEKSMAMASIRNMIQSEVFYLSGQITQSAEFSPRVYEGANITVNNSARYQNLYVYFYDDSDYQRDVKDRQSGHSNTAYKSLVTNADNNRNASPSKKSHSVKNQNNHITHIDFKQFIESRPSLHYLNEEQQRSHYRRYLSGEGIPIQTDQKDLSDEDVW
jgi:hypothetical protein